MKPAVLCVAAILLGGCASAPSPGGGADPSLGSETTGDTPAAGDSGDPGAPAGPPGAATPPAWDSTTYAATFTGQPGEWIAVLLPLREPLDSLVLERSFSHKVKGGDEAGAALAMAPGPVWLYEGQHFLPSRHLGTTLYEAGASGGQGTGDKATYMGSGRVTGVFWAFAASRPWNVSVAASLPDGGEFTEPVVRRGLGFQWWDVPVQSAGGAGGSFAFDQEVPAGWSHVEIQRAASLAGETYAEAIRYRLTFPDGFAWPPPPYDQTAATAVGYEVLGVASGHNAAATNRVVGSFAGPAGVVHGEGTFAGTRLIEHVVVASIPAAQFEAMGLPELWTDYAQF